jgi:hypothetical protein
VEKRKIDQLLPEWGLKQSLLLFLGLVCISLVFAMCFACAFFVPMLMPTQGCWATSHCSNTPIPVVIPRQLPLDLIDSAQDLLKSPAPLPSYLQIASSVPYDGETATICVYVDRFQFVTATNRFKMNGTYLSNEHVNTIVYGRVEDKTLEICAYAPLDRGLHLIEFEALLYDGYRNSYAWAIEIK